MIIIRKTKNADSRTAEDTSRKALLDDTIRHQNEVFYCMLFLADKINNAGLNHDWTKTDDKELFRCKDGRKDTAQNLFYQDYKNHQGETQNDGELFKKDCWNQIHIHNERHHLNGHVPDDVNLIDVLELICDCVCAGKGRYGGIDKKYFMIGEVLEKAYWNTVDLIDKNTEYIE